MSRWLPPAGGGYTGAKNAGRSALTGRLVTKKPPEQKARVAAVPRPPRGSAGVSRAS